MRTDGTDENMTSLDIDMGNTRTKWRMGRSLGALPSPGLPDLNVEPSRVRVATVLRNRDMLDRTITERYGVQPEFATTAAELAGVQCGYANPDRLGVDRWLAVVAAWRRSAGPVMVISVGTAATADFVDADGLHEGGHIAPGPRLLRIALDRETADVRPKGSIRPCMLPGADTDAAVASGTYLMLLGFAETAVKGFAARHGCDAKVFLTGGDADLLAERLSVPVRCEPHLVLDGLEIALP